MMAPASCPTARVYGVRSAAAGRRTAQQNHGSGRERYGLAASRNARRTVSIVRCSSSPGAVNSSSYSEADAAPETPETPETEVRGGSVVAFVLSP
jgi:hypothetical protein